MGRSVLRARMALGLVVVMAALVFAAGRTAAQAEQVVIGLLAPLSGNYAAGGWSIANGAQLAIDEANASGRYSVRFILKKEDTRADQMQALNAMTKLIEFDRAVAIVGPMLSGSALTAGPIAQEAGVPFITPAASAQAVSEIGDFQFRNMITNQVQAAQMAEYAIRVLGLKRLAIMYTNNDYGVALSRDFEAAVKAAGGEVVAVESFLDGDTNFSAQITNVAAAAPDGLYIAGYYTEAALIAQQAAFHGLRAGIMGGDALDSPALIDLGGTAVEGALLTSGFHPDIQGELGRSFVQKYEAAYGRKPDVLAANAYDSARILIHVISQVGTDGAKIRDEIAALKAFPGVTGPTSFAPNGDAVKPVYILMVENGNFVRVR